MLEQLSLNSQYDEYLLAMILIYFVISALITLLIWMKYFRVSFLKLFIKRRKTVALLGVNEIEYEQPTERYNLIYIFPELVVSAKGETQSIRLRKNYSTSIINPFGAERASNEFTWRALKVGQDIELVYS